MKVVITGASGFIGSHLIRIVSQRDVEVVEVARSADVLKNNRANHQVLVCDISTANESNLEEIANADLLIHLAWDGLLDYRSIHHIEYELPAQFAFLKSLVQRGLKNIAVTGTCLEYGLISGALSEDFISNPVTSYGYAKDCLRKQLQFLQQDYDFNLCWMRLFYTFGEGQAKNSLFSLIQTAVDGGSQKFDLSGGEQLRDYLPIEILVELITEVALKCNDVGVVNICSGEPVSIRRLVENWTGENEWQIKLNFGCLPYVDYEPLAFWGERSKLNSILIS